jgi:hypothetical protein
VAVHGKNAFVAFNLYNITGFLRSAEFNADIDVADTTTFGQGWKTAIVGMGGSTASFEGLYDMDQTVYRDQLQASSGVLTYCPGGGSAIGDQARLLPVTGTSYVESSPVGDVVSFSWEVMSDAAVAAAGQVLHPIGEDTNTTVGASKDDASATATGWTAHLHVGVVDGGSWVVKLEDSANNSDWADVSGGAFTAATGGTWQRLTSSSTTAALRRYVRYTATRTGGSSGDGILFTLAYARSA